MGAKHTKLASTVGFTYEGACKAFWGAHVSDDARNAQAARYWNAAREAVGLEPFSIDKVWNSFYFHPATVERTWCSDGSLAYKDVWKGANNFFQRNLNNLCNGSSVAWAFPSPDHPLAMWVAAREEPNGVLFSYVRDPVSRFASAYREVAFRLAKGAGCLEGFNSTLIYNLDSGVPQKRKEVLRGVNTSIKGFTCGDFDQANGRLEALAEAILIDLLNGNPRMMYKHFAPMSAFLFANPPYPSFFGRLECIQDDWKRLCSKRAKCPPSLAKYEDLSLEYGQHPVTSGDVYGYGAGLAALRKSKPQWDVAIHHLTALDNACFDTYTQCRERPPSPPHLHKNASSSSPAKHNNSEHDSRGGRTLSGEVMIVVATLVLIAAIGSATGAVRCVVRGVRLRRGQHLVPTEEPF